MYPVLLSVWQPVSVSWMNDMITCGVISPISSSPALLPAKLNPLASAFYCWHYRQVPLCLTCLRFLTQHATGHCTVSCTPMLVTAFCSSQVTESPRWALLAEWKKKTEWIKEYQWAMHTIQLTQQQGSETSLLEGKWASVREAGVTQTTVRIVSLTHEIWGGWKIWE